MRGCVLQSRGGVSSRAQAYFPWKRAGLRASTVSFFPAWGYSAIKSRC